MPSQVILPISLMKNVASGSENVQVRSASPGLMFTGHSARADSGGATYALRAGTGTGDPLLFPRVVLGASGQAFNHLMVAGVRADAGIFLHRISGNCEVTVYHTFSR